MSRRAERQKKRAGKAKQPTSVIDMMVEDSNKEAEVKESSLEKLKALIEDMEKLEASMLQAQELLNLLKKNYEDINQRKIPDLLDECGLSEIKLADGRKIEVKTQYYGSINANNQLDCHNWLEKNGFGDLIKHDVTAKIPKGETDNYHKLMDSLGKLGFSYVDKEYVHHKTLSAFIKEQIEKGAEFPQELFKVAPIRTTKIK